LRHLSPFCYIVRNCGRPDFDPGRPALGPILGGDAQEATSATPGDNRAVSTPGSSHGGHSILPASTDALTRDSEPTPPADHATRRF